jgi:large subunit ribosomal protein L10
LVNAKDFLIYKEVKHMAISRAKKEELVNEMAEILSGSRMTVVAEYKDTPVKAMENLRNQARERDTQIRVIKNRLVIKAIKSIPVFSDLDTGFLNGMLLYSSSSADELTAAQVLADFARTQPTIKIIGALTPDGQFVNADDTKALAALPSKDVLRAQLAGTIAAPLSGFVGVVSGNIRQFVQVLTARSENLS